jgi:ligand-binding sensor domain-containing protein
VSGVLFALIFNCYALDPSRTVSQYARESWGLRSGLPRGQVSSITQGADGYLWVGTDQGPRRFDGQGFTSLEVSGSDHFPPDRVLGLASDQAGGLWIRLRGPTLLRYQNGSFGAMTVTPNRDGLVTAMANGQGGSLLFASRLDGVFRWKTSNFEIILSKAAIPSSPIISLAASANGDVWLGTNDIGLLRFHENTVIPITNGLPDLKITCLLEAAEGELYVGTNRGLARWDGARLTRTGVPKVLLELPILAMVKDRDSNIWIGTSKGLLRLNAQGISSFGEADSGKPVTALFEDREGDLWTGSVDELQRIQESAFVTYRSERVGPVHPDSQGRIWTAPIRGGLSGFRDTENKEFEVPGLGPDEVYSIAGNGDDLWLGRKLQGLTRVIFRDGVWSSRTYTRADGLPQNSVYAVHQNRDGTIWAGTLTGGVSHFQDGRFTNYDTASGLVSNTILSIAEDAEGTMWFATPVGLSSFAKHRWTTYGTRDGLPSESVNTLFEDSSKILWLGTLRGIALLRDGKVFVPHGLPPLLLDQVFGIAEDRLASFWITTSRGLLRIERGRLLAGGVSNQDVREFGISDGLIDPSGVRRERSIAADPSGRIWVSTTSGLVSVNPARVLRNSAPTIVHIDRIVSDGEQQVSAGFLHLRPLPKRISIAYAGLNLSSPESVRYRFKLDGFDSDWSAPVSTKEAVYTNLTPGPYRFHVIAGKAGEFWNEAEATLFFNVDPALWQTRWFQAASILTLILSMFVFYRLRLRQVTEQVNSRFEARLAERARIARELHDTLLQSFHGLMLRFQAVHNLLPDQPSQAKQSLEIAIDRAASAITESRDAIQELRTSELANSDLIETFTLLGRELAISDGGQEPPTFRVLVEGTPRPLHPSLQEDLYRISREAIANAFAHAHASHIELDIRYDARILRLRVRDDGIGMNPSILAKGGLDGHWGLPGMKERAKAIHGHLEIWSELSGGTEIELSVPAHIAYSELKRASGKL